MEKLKQLKQLYEDGYIEEHEYKERKNILIDAMINNDSAPSRPAATSAAPSRGRVVQSAQPRPSAGRVAVVNGPPPRGRVVEMDAPPSMRSGPSPASPKSKVQYGPGGGLLCSRCSKEIKGKVYELDRMPYDSVCVRLQEVTISGTGNVKMSGLSESAPAPVRTYVNRKGDREVAAVERANAKAEKKFGNKHKQKAARKIAEIERKKKQQQQKEAARNAKKAGRKK